MAPQIGRIALVFGAFVLLFLGARTVLVPEGFAEDGFHRLEGPGVVASAPTHHAGMPACADCHPDKIESTPHVRKKVHCESCHQAAGEHVKDWEKAKPFAPSSRADCTRCHAKVVSRPAWYPQIDPKKHNPDSKCVDCHEIHPAAEESGDKKPEGGKP